MRLQVATDLTLAHSGWLQANIRGPAPSGNELELEWDSGPRVSSPSRSSSIIRLGLGDKSTLSTSWQGNRQNTGVKVTPDAVEPLSESMK